MPHYDESFIHDDNQNQRRNKRSYRVYKHGLNPLSFLETHDVFHTLEERGTSVIKKNIKNIKHRNSRKPETSAIQPPHLRNKTPDIIVDHCPRMSVFDPSKYYDLRNNNIYPLSQCKSFDNLTIKPSKRNDVIRDKIRGGVSLQNLLDDGKLKLYISPSEEILTATRTSGVKNSYSIVDARHRPPPQRRVSRGTPAPGVGVYRQIVGEKVTGIKAFNTHGTSIFCLPLQKCVIGCVFCS